MKKLLTLLALGLTLSLGNAYAADAAACEKSAADKKLAGAAKTSHIKKCMSDDGAPSAACEKSAADKKLAGAAKTSHIKKCMADAK
jgi:Tfp pilus assembly protein PilV